jgi:putative transposase
METDKIKQRKAFVDSYLSDQWSMAELCEHFGVSRPTGYEWVSRYDPKDPRSLLDRSSAPGRQANRTDPETEALILWARSKYKWGAKKLRWRLEKDFPGVRLPARSTMNAILDRHGLLRKRRRRNHWLHPGAVPVETDRPNQVWPMDFKGQFKMRNGEYCYPLTVTDHYSRSLLACHGLPSVKGEGVKPLLQKLFREVGLPEAIRTDNGSPFASTGIHGLCALNVWWMQLGIVHQRIRPGKPQENGQHERMHRDLKWETARPPYANMQAQQAAFDEFQHRFNNERPHEALDGAVPSDLWRPSPRLMPEVIKPPEYPGHFEVRKVSHCGAIRLACHQRFVSNALKDEYVGLEEVDDGIWNIVYYTTLLGRIDERDGRITGVQSVKKVPGLL